MQRHWTEMMNVGLVHFMAYPIIKDEGPILESAEAIATDPFFDVLEVRRSEQPGVHAKLRHLAEVSGLSLGVGAQPGLLLGKLSLNSRDAAAREAAIAEVKKSIDAAYELGARLVACLSGPDPGEEHRAEETGLLADSCVQLCRYAQQRAETYAVWLSLEQFDDAVDKRCLVGPTARAAQVAERVRTEVDNFGLCLDLSHVPLLGERAIEALSVASPYLIHVHAGNCIMRDKDHAGYGDLHPRFGHPAGENGVEELKDWLSALIYVGYFDADVPTKRPVFTFEVKPLPDETPELVIANTKRTFMQAWAQLWG